MKGILTAAAVAVAALAAVPASAGSFGVPAKPHVRGIPLPHWQTFKPFKIHKPVRIIGVVVRPKHPIPGLVTHRSIGSVKATLVRGVPAHRLF